jgi:hypothetical protein
VDQKKGTASKKAATPSSVHGKQSTRGRPSNPKPKPKKGKSTKTTSADAANDEDDDGREWIVDRISDIRKAPRETEENQGYEYLVHWSAAAYDPSWIATCLISPNAIHEFWLKNYQTVRIMEPGYDGPPMTARGGSAAPSAASSPAPEPPTVAVAVAVTVASSAASSASSPAPQSSTAGALPPTTAAAAAAASSSSARDFLIDSIQHSHDLGTANKPVHDDKDDVINDSDDDNDDDDDRADRGV